MMALLYQMQRTTITLKASVVENTEDQRTHRFQDWWRRVNVGIFIYQHQYNKRVIEISVLCCIIEGDQLHLKFSHWRTELSASALCLISLIKEIK